MAVTLENKNLNIPELTVSKVVQGLARLYTNVCKSGLPFKSFPTPFFWGPAGVGKSEAVQQLAEELRQSTGKIVTVTDVRLLLFSPVDLRGVPVADEKKEFSRWLRPKIFDMKAGDEYINLLFLDELSAAPQSVQAAAYQICLDRRVGEHQFPDNCIVIAAGNRTTDQSVSYKMPKALCNRMMHYDIRVTYEGWREWAVSHDIDPRIVGYLAFDNSKLFVEPTTADMAYPTPRSWTFVSNILRAFNGDETMCHNQICACIGKDTTVEFEAWMKTHDHMPCVEDVLQGKRPKRPDTQDALYAFCTSLVAAVRSRREEILTRELENLCEYMEGFPADVTMMLYGDLNKMEDIWLRMTRCAACERWLKRNKKFFKGDGV